MEDRLKEKMYIKRNGAAYITGFDEEKDEWEFNKVNPDHILYHLTIPIALEEKFTLRDYFKFIENYPRLQWLDYFLPFFMVEYKDCPESGCKDEDLNYLFLQKTGVYSSYNFIKASESFIDEDIEIDPYIELFISFSGRGKGEDGNRYGIEFSPLNTLLDLEIKFEQSEISIEKEGNIQDFSNFEDKFITRYAESDDFTLYEFFKNIIWELSFAGKPKDRDQEREKLNQISKEGDYE